MNGFKKKLSVLVYVLAWVLIGKIAMAQEMTKHQTGNVQVAHLDLYDKERQRPVKVTIWYPAVSTCEQAKLCLANNVKLDQGAVFSHGAMGAAKGYNWIGYALASQGIVTLGLNHYGESWAYGPKNIDPSAVLRFWQRPLDIRFVLDQLQSNRINTSDNTTIFDRNINWNNVTAIGHSSGGATVTALVGSEVELTKAEAYCQTQRARNDKSCGYLQHKTAHTAALMPKVSFIDKRIKRVIALDPALGHITKQASLKKIDVPVLVIGSKQNDFLTYERHAGFYAAHIPNVKNVILNQGEGHFVYLDTCEHNYQALGVSLCIDKEGVQRDKVHQGLYPHIFSFIYRNQAIQE